VSHFQESEQRKMAGMDKKPTTPKPLEKIHLRVLQPVSMKVLADVSGVLPEGTLVRTENDIIIFFTTDKEPQP